MEAVATNLANVHTTRTEEGGPFRKKEVVFIPSDVSETKGFRASLDQMVEGVKVEDIVESPKQFERTYDPFHPDADPEGYVTLPNVNLMEEMADMVAATRAYEANITVINGTKDMFIKSLEIGK
jgi:flagellar basal-body rod protein FlgC